MEGGKTHQDLTTKHRNDLKKKSFESERKERERARARNAKGIPTPTAEPAPNSRSRSRSNEADSVMSEEHEEIPVPPQTLQGAQHSSAGKPPGDFDLDAWGQSMSAQVIANMKVQVPQVVRQSMASAGSPLKKYLIGIQQGESKLEQPFYALERAMMAGRIGNQANTGSVTELKAAVEKLTEAFQEMRAGAQASAASGSADPPHAHPASASHRAPTASATLE